jgi:capsid portal protein
MSDIQKVAQDLEDLEGFLLERDLDMELPEGFTNPAVAANLLRNLQAENERLREALKEIETQAVKWEFYPIADRARRALERKPK